jgi:hypothetical protein
MWQFIVIILILFAIYYVVPTPTVKENFAQHPQKQSRWWGPYMWGWKSRPFYDYYYHPQTPHPYQNECDHYARYLCQNSNHPLCYKNYYMKCAAGNAWVNHT